MFRSLAPTTLPGKLFAGLLIWFVVVVFAWGLRPMTDHLPVRCIDPDAAAESDGIGGRFDRTGRDGTDAEGDAAGDSDGDSADGADDDDVGCAEDEADSIAVSCHAPLSFDDSPRGELPSPEEGWAYERGACDIPVQSAAQLMGLNAVTVAISGAGFAWWATRRSVSG